jgi:hypothetical protein
MRMISRKQDHKMICISDDLFTSLALAEAGLYGPLCLKNDETLLKRAPLTLSALSFTLYRHREPYEYFRLDHAGFEVWN